MRHLFKKAKNRLKRALQRLKEDYTVLGFWTLLRASTSLLEGFYLGVGGVKKQAF
jgi:hypothetical protein